MAVQGGLARQFPESALYEAQKAFNAAAVLLPDETQLNAVRPGVVALGLQSHGKSGLLSRIAGVELPTGIDLCTRCPLQLELRNCQESQGARISYSPRDAGGVFSEQIAVDDIQGAVEKAQIALAGDGREISSLPIRLEVFSPSTPDVTITDLPGLIEVNLDDQPETVVEQIRNLIMKALAGKYTVILCIVSAAADVQSNQVIKLAREVDPEGARTLGVITKCDRCEGDLVDRAKTYRSLFPCGQGYCMVRGRSPQDEQAGMSQSDVTTREEKFFASRMHAPVENCTTGLQASIAKLMSLAAEAICKAAPDCLAVINNRMDQLQAEQSQHQQSRVTSLEQVPYVLANYAGRIKDEFDNVDRSDMRGLDNPSSPGHREVNAQLKRAALDFRQQVEKETGGVAATRSSKTYERIETELERVTGKHLPTVWLPSVLTTIYKTEVHNKLRGPVQWLQEEAWRIVQRSLDAIIEICIPEEDIRNNMQTAMREVLENQAGSLQTSVECLMTCYAFVYSYDEEKFLAVLHKLKGESQSQIKKICEQAEPVADAIAVAAPPQAKAALSAAKGIADVVQDEQEDPDSSAKDCQRMLSAYTTMVLEDIIDHMPRLCRYHLIHQVLNILRTETPNPLICTVDQQKALKALEAGGRKWAQLDENLKALQSVRDTLRKLT